MTHRCFSLSPSSAIPNIFLALPLSGPSSPPTTTTPVTVSDTPLAADPIATLSTLCFLALASPTLPSSSMRHHCLTGTSQRTVTVYASTATSNSSTSYTNAVAKTHTSHGPAPDIIIRNFEAAVFAYVFFFCFLLEVISEISTAPP